MLSKHLLSSKLTIALLIILLFLLGNLKYKQWQSQKAIEKEKQSLNAQAESLERKNKDLSDSLSYINSPDFKERIARQELGLKKEGEIVFDFSEKKYTNPDSSAKKTENGKTNIQKWWEYFTKSL